MSIKDAEAEVERLRKMLAAAQATSMKWAERRHKLPIGSSRARVTTANANWANAAEARDRAEERLEAAERVLAALVAK